MHSTVLRSLALICGIALTGCRAIQGLGELSFDGSGGGGGGGATGAEDCENGDDDDGDGLTDCADPDCGAVGYACVAAPPSGWSGPIAVYEGPFAAAIPPCPDLFPDHDYEGDTGPEAAAATCDECTCAAAQITCEVSLSVFKNSNCKSSSNAAPLTPGSCVQLDTSASSLRLNEPTTTVQACAPSGGTAVVPPLERSTRGITCGTFRRSGGCSAGEICAPRPRAPFHEAMCISRGEAKSCPASYPAQHHLEQVVDNRGCSPCTCGSPSPSPSCAATTTLYSDTACGVEISSLPNDDSCKSSIPASAKVAITGSGIAACEPKGGTPTGSVNIVNQITICCSE